MPQTLTASGHTPRYWVSKSDAEVDFVVTLDDDGAADASGAASSAGSATPIEVKSSGNVRSRSLGVYRAKYQPSQAIRLSTKNFGVDNDVTSVPLYAAFCL
ncbi:hypothetical protein PT282_00615 [Bifidobacterium sp. ESL0763]|uniref:hypothetical protein n=1 Tax=Bifidobacterium sp. ESL0763 TaxID=2983227 RepID=UPI0023FA375E|nr:hypothetical protein [Bifidobacterium sp. ESL0763]MDF7663185.1 hypothetical protein [Bifidobacterium sp. ESL0763]